MRGVLAMRHLMLHALFHAVTLFSHPAIVPVHSYDGDMVIRNTTSLLDSLLDNYDKKLRPGHGGDTINACNITIVQRSRW